MLGQIPFRLLLLPFAMQGEWNTGIDRQCWLILKNYSATSQLILLPGNNWTSAETFVSNGSADALNKVTNPDGTKTGLIFDVHKYLDSDNSGTHADCVTNNIDNAWQPLATWLRANGRQALNTETGGGNTDSCAQFLCEQIAFQEQNSDGQLFSLIVVMISRTDMIIL